MGYAHDQRRGGETVRDAFEKRGRMLETYFASTMRVAGGASGPVLLEEGQTGEKAEKLTLLNTDVQRRQQDRYTRG